MPSNKFAYLRYRIIDFKIRSGTYPNLEDLRQSCEEELNGSTDGSVISKSTIEKDLNAMRNEQALGYAPIKYSHQRRGYFYDDPDYQFSEFLSKEELELVSLSASVLNQFKGSNLLNKLEATIHRINQRVNLSKSHKPDEVDKWIQFEHVPLAKGIEFLEPLYQSISSTTAVEVKYLRFDDSDVKTHKINPLVLREYRNRWYLIAWYEPVQDFMILGLDRIQSLSILDEKFENKYNFDACEYFHNSIGVTVYKEDPVDVELSFSSMAGKYIKTLPVHDSQEILIDNQSELRIRIKVVPSYELMSLILGYSSEVKVLKPDSLKEEVIKELRNSLENYY